MDMGSQGQRGRSPNARLQDRILLYLGHHDDVETVVGLARSLESPRSSTSRAINRLRTDGLVQKVEGTWVLTDEGRAEETRLHSRLRKRSEKDNMEIERIVKRQEEWDRTIAFSGIEGVNSALESINRPTRESVISVAKELAKAASISMTPATEELAKAARVSMTPAVQELAKAAGVPIASATAESLSSLRSPVTSAVESLAKTAMTPVSSAVVRLNYQVRPFAETMRLVNSVGIGNPATATAIKSLSESVLANQSSYMESVSKAVSANSFAPTRLEALFDNLNLINRRIGETAFASIQVRAVEDFMQRISSTAIRSDAFKAFEAQMDLAAGAEVRQVLEQADVDDLLDEVPVEDVNTKRQASDTPEDTLSALPNDTRSELFYKTWDELSEQMRLRYVAVATFLILHVAFLAAQHQPTSYEYLMGRIHALEGTLAAVGLCHVLGLFKDEE
jgi:DNA-binding MarR family transcriptional regulator